MEVTIGTRVTVQHGGGKVHIIPEHLIVAKDGEQWLKIMPTNSAIVALIYGDKAFPKGASLADSAGLKTLKSLRNQILWPPPAAPIEAAEELFDGAAGPKRKKQKKEPPRSDPVDVDIPGHGSVKVLPVQKANDDLIVPLDSAMLSAVFAVISLDEPIVHKRSYNKSGKFVKKD